MRYARLFPLAVASILAACSDPSTSPPASRDLPTHPSFSPGTGAHFLSLGAALSGANLDVSFREGGLGNTPATVVNISAVANATATYACINGGNNHPKASNKEDVSGPVGASGDFPITKNGSASGSVTLNPPASTLACPSGQRFVLAAVTYANVLISDNTNGLLNVPVPGGPFSRVFVNLE